MSLILPWWWRWAALGIALLAAAAFGAAKMHSHDQKRYDALEASFEGFKDKVVALGIQAKKDAKDKEAADKKRKEDADAENARTVATLSARIGELRKSRPGGSFVPPATPGSRDPDRIAFDRPEFERATRSLVEGVRRLADEGSTATVNLDTAKRWAQAK